MSTNAALYSVPFNSTPAFPNPADDSSTNNISASLGSILHEPGYVPKSLSPVICEPINATNTSKNMNDSTTVSVYKSYFSSR